MHVYAWHHFVVPAALLAELQSISQGTFSFLSLQENMQF